MPRRMARARSASYSEPLLVMRSSTACRARCSGRPENSALRIVRRLTQLVGFERLADFDDLLDDVSAAGDDDDQHAASS